MAFVRKNYTRAKNAEQAMAVMDFFRPLEQSSTKNAENLLTTIFSEDKKKSE